jgi:L-asparaginase II
VPAPGVVEELRGAVVEARHLVHAAICRADGTLVAAAGDPRHVTYLRSSAKPLQALPSVAAGTLERFGLGDAHLAVACGSHHGTPAHAATVADLLARAGVPLGALRPRGLHAPLDPDSARRLAMSGSVPSPLEHNCSGNHALMLALSRHLELPLERYLDPGGEPQQRATAAVAEVAGEQPALGVDRCGMTAYALPLAVMAATYARLATGSLPAAWQESGRRVVGAMRARPELVAGPSALDTAAMGLDGVIAKGGARGVFCCASVTTGLGGALKVEDGDQRAARLAASLLVEAVAEAPGALVHFRDAPIADGNGTPVGAQRVALAFA